MVCWLRWDTAVSYTHRDVYKRQLLMMITVRTWLFLLTVFFVVWMLADGVITILYLRKLQKRLLSGRSSSGKINWKGRSGRHFTKCFTQICIAGILVVAYGSLWSDTMLDKNLITLDQYLSLIHI